MISLNEISLADIAPDSITKSKNVQASIFAIDPELKLISSETRKTLILSRLDELPENVIDLLAEQYHTDFYDVSLTIEQKRNLVRDSILWHRKKGTVWAIRRVLENLGLKCNIKEWFNTGALPYTFSVEIVYPPDPSKTFTFMGENTEELIRDAINNAKPVRADLSNLVATTLDQIEQDGYVPEIHVCLWDGECMWDHAYIETIGKPEVVKFHDTTPQKVTVALDYQHSTEVITQAYLIWNVSKWGDWPYVVQPNAGFSFTISDVVKVENQSVKYTELTNIAETESVWDCGVWDGITVTEPYIKVLESVGTWDGSAVWNALATVPDDGSQYHTLDTWQDREGWSIGTWASLEASDKKPELNKRNLYEPHWDRVEHFGTGGGSVIDISEHTLSQAKCGPSAFVFSVGAKFVNDRGRVSIIWHERAGYTWDTAPKWGTMNWKDEGYYSLTDVINTRELFSSTQRASATMQFFMRDFARYLTGPTWDFTKWDNGEFMRPNTSEIEEHVSRIDNPDTFGMRVMGEALETFSMSEAVWNDAQADGLEVMEPQYRIAAKVGEWDSDAAFDAELNPPEPTIVKVEEFSTGYSCTLDISGIVRTSRAGNFVWHEEV